MAAEHAETKRCKKAKSLSFTINGKIHTVPNDVSVSTPLVDYLRDGLGLKGTKVMCREGGCGCCAVTVRKPGPESHDQAKTFSINSCMCPLYSVSGCDVTTIEGLGSSKNGYHPIQERVAEFNATQCGYCTPGMVVNMFGLLNQKNPLTSKDIEDKFDGNICRCTGYRPILDAMRTFIIDDNTRHTVDIEDINKGGCRQSRSCNGCPAVAEESPEEDMYRVSENGTDWYRPNTLAQLTAILTGCRDKKVRLFFGNTSTGIYKHEGPFDTYVYLHDIDELYKIEMNAAIVKVGSNICLTDLISTLTKIAVDNGYVYCTEIAQHLQRVANTLVRNAGTWAGNLMVKHAHPEFPSDVVTLFEAAEVKLHILDTEDTGAMSVWTIPMFLRSDMSGKVIVAVELPRQDERTHFRSFKITPRNQNAHAYVNAAFRMVVDGYGQVVGKPSLIYGGIHENMLHASKTEDLLTGKCLDDADTMHKILRYLYDELVPSTHPMMSSAVYRRNLAVNLFYKFLVSAVTRTKPSYLHRPLSTSTRDFKIPEHELPLKAAMPKLTSKLQASGEAMYVDDLPAVRHQLYGAFVLATIGSGTIKQIQADEALRMPGVVDFLTAKDVPGVNNAIVTSMPSTPEEVFCSGDVKHCGQQIGFIIAESQSLAEEAAKRVKVEYSDVKSPVLTIEDVIKQNSYHANPLSERKVGDTEAAMVTCEKVVEGESSMDTVYHFYMENNVAVCYPTESGIEVHTPNQSLSSVQRSIAAAIGKPCNYVHVVVPRVGGSFGGKAGNLTPICIASAIAVQKLNRPVRTTVSMADTMSMCGKRFPVLAKYKVGYDRDGRLQAVNVDIYCDTGYTKNWTFNYFAIPANIDSGYHCPNWKVRVILCKTNKATNLSMRAPINFPCGFIMESIIEHVAHSLNMEPIEVKQLNLYQEAQKCIMGHQLNYCSLRRLWTEVRQSAEVDRRLQEVEQFNKENRWRKRGLSMTPVKYNIHYNPIGFSVDIAIYDYDGTVTVSQGGVEMGQGLYTKVAQAVASSLNIPVTYIRVLANNSHNAANNFPTAGSSTSELAVQSALECCEVLKERMAVVREDNPDADWMKVVQECYKRGIDLSAKYKWKPVSSRGVWGPAYFSYAAGVCEVEMDVLTGENHIRRVDIHFDCGESLNPDIDIGQIEGSYLMGLGALLLEQVMYDDVTGKVLNNTTWEYKPPMSKDIPIDWRIKLLEDAPCPEGIRGSKKFTQSSNYTRLNPPLKLYFHQNGAGAGEPPIVLSSGAFFALKHAIGAARAELTGERQFIHAAAPLTVEKIQLECEVDLQHLRMVS